MARMAKLMRALPELLILIKGIIIATRTVFFTLFLLMLIIYVYAVLFTLLCKEDPELKGNFGAMKLSMVTLLIAGAFPDLEDIMGMIMERSVIYWFLFVSFVLLASLTVM